MRRNWLVLLIVCLAVVMMAVLPGCRSKPPADDPGTPGDEPKVGALPIGKAGTYDFKVADLTWEKVKDPVNASLSEMKDLNAIETDPAENKPDFSKVTGGGVYIVDGNSKGNLNIGSIKWAGASENVEDVFEEFPEGTDSYGIIQGGKINVVSSPDTGYAWTAYCADWDTGANLAQMDQWYDGRIKMYGSEDKHKGGAAEDTFIKEGSYVYTIFTAGPEMKDGTPDADWTPGEPDKELDMTEGSVVIEFLGESDSTLAYPVLIKLLLRDANGDWYVGAPVGDDEPGDDPGKDPGKPEDPVAGGVDIAGEGEYTINVADLSWEKVKDPANTNMSKFATSTWGNNPNKIETESGTPDLTKVTGGGFIILESTDTNGNFFLSSIKWEGEDDEVTETFIPQDGGDYSLDVFMVQYKQYTELAISLATEYGWIGYVETCENANSVQMDKHWGGRIKFYGDDDGEDLKYGTRAGTYVYTMFVKNPEANTEPAPDSFEKELDMTNGKITVNFGAEDGGPFPIKIGLLLRDASGNWFVGK